MRLEERNSGSADGGLAYSRRVLSSFDPEELRDSLGGTDSSEYRRLPGGQLRVELEHVALPSSVLKRRKCWMPIWNRGKLPATAITIYAWLDASAIGFHPEGMDFDCISRPHSDVVTLTVERADFQRAAVKLLGHPLSLPEQGSVQRQGSPSELEPILAAIGACFRAGRRRAERWDAEIPHRLEYDLLAAYIRAFDAAPPRPDRTFGWELWRMEVVRRTVDYLDRFIDEPFDMTMLSAATGLTPRSIQRAFQAMFEMSPTVWFRTERLHRAHDDFLHARGSVTDVASRWGFLHFGHFSAEYRKLFGELPRTTASTGRARHPSVQTDA